MLCKIKFLRCFFLLLLVAYLENFNLVLASETFKNELGLWTAVNINLPITEKIQSRFQFSPRWLNNVTDFNQFIIHGLLGYKFNEHLSFFQGYAWSTYYAPRFIREQRPYNDLVISYSVNKLSFEHRFG